MLLEVCYENALYRFTFDIDIDIVTGIQEIESKKALEAAQAQAAQTEAQDSTENVEQTSTAEKTECVDDKNDKAPSRGMRVYYYCCCCDSSLFSTLCLRKNITTSLMIT